MKKFLNSFMSSSSDATSTLVSKKTGSSFPYSQNVNSEKAQRLSNVFGCVNIKANALSVIPIKLYERTKEGKEEAYSHGLYEILRYSPNPNLTASEWKKMLSQDLDLRGNHYCQIIRNGLGEVTALYPLISSEMIVEWGPNKKKLYKYSGTLVPSSQILHIIDIPDKEGLLGLSRIEYARQTLEFESSVSQHGNKVFKNSVSPAGAFSKKGSLTDDAFERLKTQIHEQFAGLNNAGKPLVLEDGLEFNSLQLTNSDAQWLESRRFNREQIATIFGVPVSMLNDAENTAFGNLEQKEQSFYSNTILPVSIFTEERFRLSLLTSDEKKNYVIKFKYNALLRTDMKTRSEFYKTLSEKGALSPNEIRAYEDMNGYDGGEKHLVQLSYSTVENIAKGTENE